MAYLFKSAVHLLLLRDNQILLQRRFNTGYMDGFYSVIAGHLDGDETPGEAIIREAAEEAGIELTTEQITPVGVMHRKSDDERIDFFFVARSWQGIPRIEEPGKSDDLNWFDMDGLPDNTVPYIRRAIQNYSSNRWFDTFGFD